MGIVNITPDSFSDGGRYIETGPACEHALRLVAEGADILDLGGESTRPQAQAVPVDEELRRVIPVIEAIRRHCQIPISIDTSKPEVMRAAVTAGATLINDVRALREPGALECAAALDAGVVLMHMQGMPRTMQKNPSYNDVLSEVHDFLYARIKACVDAGIDCGSLIVDPGFGFGKNLDHNLQLLANLNQLCAMATPVLVGVSRKSMLGAMIDRDVDDRVHASVALAVYAADQGAAVLRVHDVRATHDALRVTAMVRARERKTQFQPNSGQANELRGWQPAEKENHEFNT